MRILLVDDDSSVLQALMATLKTMPGHEIRVAANAQKAHEHAEALGGLDLLITDVVMEPTDGFTLRAELQTLYPQMRAVFISGYDLSEYVEQTSDAHVLAKPVDADVLRAVVVQNLQALVGVANGGGGVRLVPGGAQAAVGIPSAAPRAVSGPTAVATPVAR